MTSYRLIQQGVSRSFPEPHAFTRTASADGAGLVILGEYAGAAYAALPNPESYAFVAIELGQECLGVHIGEFLGDGPLNVVGFARFRLGRAAPTPLVEIVKASATASHVLSAAVEAFQSADLVTAICKDFPGRIVDRLVRPYYNAVLRRFDEGLASAQDLDKTLCLGLGYPQGPLTLLERTGLEYHYDVTAALYQALGQEAYAPARRAQVARQRADREVRKTR